MNYGRVSFRSLLIFSVVLQFIFFTGGIVFLTLIVNGSTTQFVLRLLGMDGLSATKVKIFTQNSFPTLVKCLWENLFTEFIGVPRKSVVMPVSAWPFEPLSRHG